MSMIHVEHWSAKMYADKQMQIIMGFIYWMKHTGPGSKGT